MNQFDICEGANHYESRAVWANIPDTYIDLNPFKETKYSETCRSVSCFQIVKLGKEEKSKPCEKVIKSLRDRKRFLLSDSFYSNTANMYLTQPQLLDKVNQQRAQINQQNKRIAYLENNIARLLDEEGVDVDNDLNKDLSKILSKCNLSCVQKMFFDEQISCSAKRDSRSHKWHSSMIRLVLHIKMVSSSAYEALRDTGAIKLPSSRTLFDYTHAVAAQEGISDGLIEMVHERVSKLGKKCQKFHPLICDEMHVSRNLVYRQSDGHLVGHTHLDEVEKEWERFDSFIGGKGTADNQPSLATTVLAFMVKGLASDVKCVVAVFPCNSLTRDIFYVRSWDVISRLEKAGIKILAFVCDGSSTNRAFFQMHEPITKTTSGVVLDTWNFCAPDLRPLYFTADVCHVLKTILNAFYNSSEGPKKTRCLQINGQKIVWKSIIGLYLKYKNSNFRKSYKLNAQNVFPNSYSCMKVRYAAQVLSETVALDLEHQQWLHQTETIKFIRLCNKCFDCLNDAFSKQSELTLNPDLKAYESVDDRKFDWLQSFLDYLNDWKKQCEALPLPPNEQAKRMLPRQTYEGIEIAIKGITAATRYLLDPQRGGASFVMARVFSQDPLEQHFSLQRAGGRGSRNPNVQQVLSKQVSLSVQRAINTRKRLSNVIASKADMEVTNEPLPKRRAKK